MNKVSSEAVRAMHHAISVLMNQTAAQIELVNRDGAADHERGRLDLAAEAIERAWLLREARQHLGRARSALLQATMGRREETGADHEPLDGVALTPKDVLARPTLEALSALGGAGRRKDVLRRVQVLLEGVLNEADMKAKVSWDGYNEPRWYGTAQKEYKELQDQGLARTDTPHGIWAISEAGREAIGEGAMEADASPGDGELCQQCSGQGGTA